MIQKFYGSEEQFRDIHQRLRQTPCPHCHYAGALILHGALAGCDEKRRTTLRGRRLFCNNRKVRNNGCGRTCSVRPVDTVRRSILGAVGLWKFLAGVVAKGNKNAAMRSVQQQPGHSAPYRIWKRFCKAQSKIRTALLGRCPAPLVPNATNPATQTIAHLVAAFPDHACPIRAFQSEMQISFL